MHDTLEERLTLLNGDLEAAAGLRSPMLARVRGEQRRRAHRRNVAAGATMAAVGILGVGSLVAFRPAGSPSGVRAGVTSASPSVSAVAPTVGVTPTVGAPAVGAKPTVSIDLKRDVMTVYDQHLEVLRTIPVTAGIAAHPSHTGTFTVTAKEATVTITSGTVGFDDGAYNFKVNWAIEVDGRGPFLYAMPWRPTEDFGKTNTTHGDIGMTNDDAQWLYNHVKAGDRIEVR